MIRTDVAHLVRFRTPATEEMRRITRNVLRKEGITRAKISVVVTDDERSTALNRRYLHHTHVTDVISFVLETDPVLEAEIHINVQQARRQAAEYEETPADECRRLLVHGLLHCVGYDDRRTKERKEMFEIQECYLDRLKPGRVTKGRWK
jgi:probable rRNA maturation factor